MNPTPARYCKHISAKLLPACFTRLLLAGVFPFVAWDARADEPMKLGIAVSGSAAVLTWSGQDVILQRSQNLDGNWIDVPSATSPFVVPITARSEFFRLKPTPPHILSVEPAYLPVGSGTFYLTGTHFAPDSTVQVGGAAGAVTFVNSGLLLVTIGALPAGAFDVSVSSGRSSDVANRGLTVENTPLESLESPPDVPYAAAVSGVRPYRVCQRRDGFSCWQDTANINPHGEVSTDAVDLAISSPLGPDFIVARSYRSRHIAAGSPLGNGWDFSYNVSVVADGSDVVIHDGSGRADKFYHQANGTYRRAEFFREGAFSGSTFTLTFADTSRWVFRPMDAAIAPGKLSEIIDRNGNALTLGYDNSGNLTTATDAVGRVNHFAYNGTGQLTSVTDFSGRTVTYAYYGSGQAGGSAGDLKSITTPAVTGTPNGNDFPNGKTLNYTYTTGFGDDRLNHNLASIIDNTGDVVQTFQYAGTTDPNAPEFRHLVATSCGTNPPTVVSYEAQTPGPGNHFAKTKVTVNDPVGNVSASLYDSRNRPVQIDEFTGRATVGTPVTSSTNQPTGKLRASDPDYFETTITYNQDSLPVFITYPRGNRDAMVYAADSNPNT
ncbi:MAG: DUF6531 domain-containing protein, partial [Verrucomicrobiota bacterium]